MKAGESKGADVREVIVFGGVGIAASALHYGVAVATYELTSATAWAANLLGIGAAVPVSYFGHACLTFSTLGHGRSNNVSLPSAARFAFTVAVAWAVSHLATLSLIDGLKIPTPIAFLVVVSFAAAGSYIAHKYWTFASAASAANPLRRRPEDPCERIGGHGQDAQPRKYF